MSRRSPLKVKDATVNIEDLVPSLKARLNEIEEIYNSFHTELVITSGKDGKHGDNSLHYQGKAVDLRIWNVLETLVNRLKEHLGPQYDVVLEKDNIHVELDPKQ